MKTILTLGCLLLFYLCVSAQAIRGEANKSAYLASRLVAHTYEGYYGNYGLVLKDSIRLTYSGNRGGAIIGEMYPDFDQLYKWRRSIPTQPMRLRNGKERTYNANNSILTEKETVVNDFSSITRPTRTYTYNSQGLVATGLIEWWEDTLHHMSKYSCVYDATGRLIERTSAQWDSLEWDFERKETFAYSATGKRLVSVTQQKVAGNWQDLARTTNTYDANDNLIITLHEGSNGSEWAPSTRYSAIYNADNTMASDLSEEYINNVWEEDNRAIYDYDVSGNRISAVNQVSHNGTWLNTYRHANVWDALGQMVEETNWKWQQGNWEFMWQKEYQYDGNGNLTEKRYIELMSNGDTGISLITNTYNLYNQILTSLERRGTTGNLIDFQKRTYYYEEYDPTSLSEIPIKATLIKPNPFIDVVMIQLDVAMAGNYTFQVFNIAGQTIYSEAVDWGAGQQTIIFDGQELPNGLYLYRIHSQSGTASGKLMKQ